MLIYAGTKSDFMIDAENDCLETKLYENIKLKMNRTTGLSELNAWRNSLKEMYITLNDSDIPKDAGVAIEYNIPQTSKRVDFLISGYGLNGKENVVIVELKQWEKLNAIDGQDAIVETYTGGANRRVVHPCYQAWSYAALIRDYNEYVQDNEIGLHPCAYLHNYPRIENDPLDKEQYQDIMQHHGWSSNKGVPIVLLTIDVPDCKVFLSDFDYWHEVLNDGELIFPYDKNMVCSKEERQNSWENIFDRVISFKHE